MLSDVVLAISCDYEEQTDWGDKIGWMYGSITEDILTGLRIHTRGWISIYCNPERAAFKVRARNAGRVKRARVPCFQGESVAYVLVISPVQNRLGLMCVLERGDEL